jgi:hypothetical protein
MLMMVSLVAASFTIPREANWKVLFDERILLSTSIENKDKNQVTIELAEVKKGGISVSYEGEDLEKGWKREIAVTDDSENELEKRGNHKLFISSGQLKSITAKGIRRIHIYTWALPTDPDKAAVMRIRRVHLCTVRFT